MPGLLIGAWAWSRADDSPLNLRPLVYVIAALGLVGTLASEADYTISTYGQGIACLFQQNSAIITVGQHRCISRYFYETDEWQTACDWNRFTSQDGGLTLASETISGMTEDDYPECELTTGLTWPVNPTIHYRWQPGKSIEHSTDGGQTWTLDNNLAPFRQEVRLYLSRGLIDATHAPVDLGLGPFSGIIEPDTGNLVLAMGHDGVLVRTPEGAWRWVVVGQYRLPDLPGVIGITAILSPELMLGGALLVLIAVTAALHIRWPSTSLLRRAWVLGLWIIWWGALLAVEYRHHATFNTGGGAYLQVDFVLRFGGLFLLIALPLSFGALWDISRNFQRYEIHIYPSALGVVLLYLFPLLLWTQGSIPRYTTALVFSLILTAAGLTAAWVYLRRVLPVVPRPPKLPCDSASGDSDEVDGG